MKYLSQIYYDEKGLNYQEKCEKMQLEKIENYVSPLLDQKQVLWLSSLMDEIQGQSLLNVPCLDLTKEMHFYFSNLSLDSQRSMDEVMKTLNFSLQEESFVSFFQKNQWLKQDESGLWSVEGEGSKKDKENLYQFFFKDKISDICKVLAIYEAHLLELNTTIFQTWKKLISNEDPSAKLTVLFYESLKDKMHREVQQNRNNVLVFLKKNLLKHMCSWKNLKNENPIIVLNYIMSFWRQKAKSGLLNWLEFSSNLVRVYILELHILFERQWALFLSGPRDLFNSQVKKNSNGENPFTVLDTSNQEQQSLIFILTKYQDIFPYWEMEYFYNKIINISKKTCSDTQKQEIVLALQNEMMDSSVSFSKVTIPNEIEEESLGYYNNLGILLRVIKIFENQDEVWLKSFLLEMQKMQRLSQLFLT